VNEIVFMVSFSVCLLLAYKKVTDFCMLTLYPDTLLKMFIRSESFLVGLGAFLSIGSSCLQIRII
jgi:pantothenate kinase